MKKRGFICTIVLTAILTSIGVLGAQQFKLIINGKNVKCDMIVKDGTTYLPLRTISNELGMDLKFENGTIYLNTVPGTAQVTPPKPQEKQRITTCAEYVNSDLFKALIDVETIAYDIGQLKYNIDEGMKLFIEAAGAFTKLSDNVDIRLGDECYTAHVCATNTVRAYMKAIKELPNSALNGGFTDDFITYYNDGSSFSKLFVQEIDKCGALENYIYQ